MLSGVGRDFDVVKGASAREGKELHAAILLVPDSERLLSSFVQPHVVQIGGVDDHREPLTKKAPKAR